MLTNPFDNPEGIFIVLVNDENQHSIWPEIAKIPLEWRAKYGPATQADCINYIETHWPDIRPASLINKI